MKDKQMNKAAAIKYDQAKHMAPRVVAKGKGYIADYVQALTHELKSPTAAIRGASELLEEEMPAEQQRRSQPHPARSHRGGAAVVGLDPARGQHHVDLRLGDPRRDRGADGIWATAACRRTAAPGAGRARRARGP